MAKYDDRIEAITDEICERLSNGEPLKAICRDVHMPSHVWVYDRIKKDPAFAERIAQARDIGFEAIAQEALMIADTPAIHEEIEEGEDGRRRVKRADNTRHRKLQVWTRLQLLAKWCPSRYGERAMMELTGKDGGPLRLADDERAARLAGLLALARQRAKAAGRKSESENADVDAGVGALADDDVSDLL